MNELASPRSHGPSHVDVTHLVGERRAGIARPASSGSGQVGAGSERDSRR